MNLERSERIEIPVLPLRDVVVYPHMVIPLFVGREKSIRCLEAAMEQDKKVLLVAQKDASTDEPTVEEIFSLVFVVFKTRKPLSRKARPTSPASPRRLPPL